MECWEGSLCSAPGDSTFPSWLLIEDQLDPLGRRPRSKNIRPANACKPRDLLSRRSSLRAGVDLAGLTEQAFVTSLESWTSGELA
jgi:hypothetical protein